MARQSRLLALPATGRWPNLAARMLKLVCARLTGDWKQPFGHPLLLLETFVDPDPLPSILSVGMREQRAAPSR